MHKRKKYNTFFNLLYAIFLQLRIAPVHTLLTMVINIYSDLVTLFEHIFLLAYIVECVEHRRPLIEILYFLVPVCIAVTIRAVIHPTITHYFGPRVCAKTEKAIHLKLYEKAVSMEISKYDNAEFYNDFVWAMQKAPEHITAITNAFRSAFSKSIVAIIAGTYVVSTDISAAFVVSFIMLSSLITQNIVNRWRMKREEEILPVSRKRDYINRVFYLSDYAKDIKTSGIREKLEKDFKESSGQMKSLVKKHETKIGVLEVLQDSFNNVLYHGGYLTYLFYQAFVKYKFGLGSLVALYNAANRFRDCFEQVIMKIPVYQQHSLYITKLRTFLDTENEMPDQGTLPMPKSGDISLQNVVFTYSGNSNPTINGVSLHIKKGEKVALVGFNGAGKSTLIKLILRLYDPDSGVISFAGHSAKDYPISEYRRNFGALFQDFEIIATDIGHNLTMDDLELEEKKADEVLKKAAFWERFQTMPEKYDTQLTKEFDESGVNLSGGEAQKIALARVLYANSGVVILDEPSSALDPIAEYQLNKTVTELAEDKTVIIISHRLSTTRFVDKIFMLENGQIIEQGNHETLLERKGKYAEMFTLQAEKYR